MLYLASSSPSRQMLLNEARIPFTLIEQTADERSVTNLPLDELVAAIALLKMNHAILPVGKENAVVFVLTADTLSQDLDGTINGKPTDYNDAVAKIRAARSGSRLSTAFCLDRRIFKQGAWQIEDRIQQIVSAQYVFDVPDHWIERYLQNSMGMKASNAIAIEGYGTQFLKMVSGSYSTIVGLPVYEVRCALEKLGLF